MFVEIPPKKSVSEYMRRLKGCTSGKIQQEFLEMRQHYWGKRFWARGFSVLQVAISLMRRL